MQSPSKNSYDAVVVGAGIIGLACAWRAAQRGLSVLVLERDEPGAGASGVAAGMLAPVTEADFGDDDLLRANLESRRLWPAFARELEELTGLDTGYAESGALVVAADRDDAEELRRLHALHEKLGLDSEWLAPSACRREEPGLSPRVAGGILAPGDAHAEPRATLGALAAALEQAGGELVSGVEVVGLESSGGHVTGVRTAGGQRGHRERGDRGRLLERRGPRDRRAASRRAAGEGPAAGAARAARAGPRSRGAHRAHAALLSPRARRRARGARRHGGGAGLRRVGDRRRACTACSRPPGRCCPEVGELALVHARAGLRPGTRSGEPVIGRGEPEGVVFATGHYRNGVLLAPLTGDAVAELLVGGAVPETVAAFAPEGVAA